MIEDDPMALYMLKRVRRKYPMVQTEVVELAAKAARDFLREQFPSAVNKECGCTDDRMRFPEEPVAI